MLEITKLQPVTKRFYITVIKSLNPKLFLDTNATLLTSTIALFGTTTAASNFQSLYKFAALRNLSIWTWRMWFSKLSTRGQHLSSCIILLVAYGDWSPVCYPMDIFLQVGWPSPNLCKWQCLNNYLLSELLAEQPSVGLLFLLSFRRKQGRKVWLVLPEAIPIILKQKRFCMRTTIPNTNLQ